MAELKRNLDYKLCSECKGKCCMTCPCHVFPDDIKREFGEITKDTLRKKILQGFVFASTGLWENKKILQTKFMRGKTKISINKGILECCPFGECIHLTETGCRFNEKRRPSGGLMLIPRKGNCTQVDGYTSEECSKEWEKYRDIVDELIEEMKDFDFGCISLEQFVESGGYE